MREPCCVLVRCLKKRPHRPMVGMRRRIRCFASALNWRRVPLRVAIFFCKENSLSLNTARRSAVSTKKTFLGPWPMLLRWVSCRVMMMNSNLIQKNAHAVASASARKDPNAGCFHAGCSEWEFDFGFRSGRLLETKIKQQLPSGCSSFSRSSNSKNQPGAALERAPKITTPIDRADDTRDTGSTIGSEEETGALKSIRGVRDKYERTDEKHAADTKHHASSARPRR